MELNHLKDFVVLAEICHFQEAANVRFTSQSTLSKHIKAVEAELGQPLFIRSRKCTELTDFGKRFLPYARKMLDIQRDYTSDLLQDFAASRVVSLGYNPMLPLDGFLEFFAGFAKENPAYQYSIVQDNSERLLAMLQINRVEFILTGNIPLPEDEYGKVPYARDSLAAVLPANHPLASREQVEIKELEKEKLLTFANGASKWHYLYHLYPDCSFQTSISIEKEDILFQLIRQGMGVSVVPGWMARHYAEEGVAARPVYPAAHVNFYMIYRKKRKLSPLACALLEHLRAG